MFNADEWRNFLTRIGRDENISESELSNSDILELRFWASYRGQTLARTGMHFSEIFCYLITCKCCCLQPNATFNCFHHERISVK